MKDQKKKQQSTIIDRVLLMELNAEGCPVCGSKFTLGEPVVLACGAWDGPKWIHEKEAVYDSACDAFLDRRYHASAAASRGK